MVSEGFEESTLESRGRGAGTGPAVVRALVDSCEGWVVAQNLHQLDQDKKTLRPLETI